ncbi:MAG: L-glutamate gamma-semialdehyde dehydrogenase [Bacteroidia bacterium]|nr:L-glutamate gamma-semialdehyde dehydrogenase [Bacteroidia bacterium]MDW8159353.1 L-glutamate gamma-semialdehyde dehydrogenase [Bacteroidia bacterium]
MLKGFFHISEPKNEPVLSYAPGTVERKKILETIHTFRSREIEIPMYIGSEKVFTGKKVRIAPPHEHKHTLGYYHAGDKSSVEKAIQAALAAKPAWEALSWESRAAIFLKAAELASGPYRPLLNAATMLGQSKTIHQAEIDSACELIDFLRFNVYYMTQIYAIQPASSPGVWNRMEYRPLEGFVFALTPFNFTAIAANLPSAPAIMGNTVVWKPSNTQIYSAQVIMELFLEAGLPPGVINLIYVNGPEAGEVIFNHPDFAGIHFTGSTTTFQYIWQEIGKNITRYKNYPRIVGETGGKDFIIAHPSANVEEVITAIIRGAFEYQGQKCSAASRVYLPKSMQELYTQRLKEEIQNIPCGGVENLENFFSAVIDEKAYDKIVGYIERAKKDSNIQEVICGGYSKEKGYIIAPTLIITNNPQSETMCEEIFGPVVTLYFYEDNKWEETLELLDKTSPYALTGAIFSKDRYAIDRATYLLRNAAGNFYINDKPTGAIVNQQPFGGSRASGTNDKAGSIFNLLRWVNVRSIKETFVPPTDYKYPFMQKEG